IAGRGPAASDSNRVCEAIGIAGWRYLSTLASMPDSLRSGGTAIRAIRTPSGVMEALPKSPRRPPPRRGTAVWAFRARQGVQYHRKTTLPGQEEDRWVRAVSASLYPI